MNPAIPETYSSHRRKLVGIGALVLGVLFSAFALYITIERPAQFDIIHLVTFFVIGAFLLFRGWQWVR